MRLVSVLALASVILAGQAGKEASAISKAHGDRFQQKLTRIVDFGNAPKTKTRATQSTQITDLEVNSYLRFNGKDQVPVGIVDPTLQAMGDGRVSGRAVVDLDAVRKQKQRGWLDPVAYLTGRLPITARGKLTTENGVGRFELESAEISGVTIPKTFVQELLSFYSKTSEDPDGINMDDPFKLPAKITQIRVGTGSAMVVQ
jgi:hypothetical protein